MRGIDLSYIEQYQEVPPCPLDSKIMFTSAYRPNVMAAALRKEGWQDLRPVITADEAEAIRIMNEKVALEESVAQFENDAKNYASPDQPPKLFKHDAVHGVDAIRDFVNYHLEPKAYTHMPQEVFPKHVDVRLKLGDNALHESYVDSAFLQNPRREAVKNRSSTDELGALKQPLRKAWSVLAKEEDDIVGIPDIYHQWDIKYSPIEVEDLESFRQELTENFLGGKTPSDCYKSDKDATAVYYLQYASADPAVDTPKKLLQTALQRMAEDGLDKRKAQTLLHHMPSVICDENYYEKVGKSILLKDKKLSVAFQNNSRKNGRVR